MSEHQTHGRQGQGARRRKNRNYGKNRYQRMPRPEKSAEKKPSLVSRVLGFFGIGKKKDENDKSKKVNKSPKSNKSYADKPKADRPKKQRNPRNQRNQQQGGEGRRRPNSKPPTKNARLYVGNLSYEATESEIEDLFKGFGSVATVEIIYNPRTYRSKGYAFVEMRYLNDAIKATEVLHGHPFMGRELMVSAANDKQMSEGEPTLETVEAPKAQTEEWEVVPMHDDTPEQKA